MIWAKFFFEIFEKFSKCQTWVTSQWEIFHVKIFFADFHELKDVDSKNVKKNFLSQKNFLGPKNAKNAIFAAKYLKNGEWFWCAVFCRCSGTMWTTFWLNLIKFYQSINNEKFIHVFFLRQIFDLKTKGH